MVFFGKEYWTEEKPVIPLMEKLAQEKDHGKEREYVRWLKATNDVDEVLGHIEAFATRKGLQRNVA